MKGIHAIALPHLTLYTIDRRITIMSTLFDKLKKFAFLRAILFIIFGGVLLYDPLLVIKWLFYIIAAYFVLMGLISIITAIVNKSTNGLLTFDFITGIILILVGVFIAIFAVQISLFIHIVMGILVIIGGIAFVSMGVTVQKTKSISGLPLIIFGIILIAAGVTIIVNPFGTQELLFRIFACVLILMGIGEIVTAVAYRKVDLPNK